MHKPGGFGGGKAARTRHIWAPSVLPAFPLNSFVSCRLTPHSMVPWHPHGHDPGTRPWPAEKTVVLAVDLKTLSGFPLSVLRPSNWHLFKSGNIKGVIRCAYEQLPPPWWSQRLFLPLKAPRPQLAGVRDMDIRLLRRHTRSTSSLRLHELRLLFAYLLWWLRWLLGGLLALAALPSAARSTEVAATMVASAVWATEVALELAA